MIIKEAKYERTAVRPDQYPEGILPEIAFVGRSNVGKSSIINALLNRKNLARVSGTPGKTREINFYNIDEKLYFVDLPGYGYASVSRDKKNSWGEVIEKYLTSRVQLRALVLLIDIRHLPSKDDKLMYEWLVAYNVPHFIVATKSDKIPRGSIKPNMKAIRDFLGIKDENTVIPFSSVSKAGGEDIWRRICGVCGIE
ncbi:MAG: YihA family ribosome biogenesis GTP-binding protein [Clostridiales bacterium]|nr:YihA family ribosome biogenesis GTP-binding protein [Clostridiales bacterium]